ncbi:MAG: porphobilinogen synthase [Deltaproteobacteria bacterium]|nr:porphobilinogen synthase [Deltaproteobacteria bacterium]
MIVRPRRLRQTPEIRRMVRETFLRADDFIYPVFVVNGRRKREIIPSMPGIYRLSIDELLKETEELKSLGVPGIILFGLPDVKDSMGSAAYAEDGVVQRAISAVKENVPGLIVLTDVCLCQYTDHGHCGVIKDGRIDNDTTIDILSDVALSHARAGADFVAPSDMMDGRVGAIRNRFEKEGYKDTGIMSYAVKYSSAFYGPFREAADSAPQFGDRKTYQMDPANSREALKEAAIDVEEGADIVMVKPALPYLDIIYQVKVSTNVPVAAYNVSGEYAMVKAADQKGWIEGQKVMMEMLLSIKRAGADIILTYFAKEAARLLNGER